MLKLTDRDGPFIHARQIMWGDTDSAQIAYTGRFLDFAVEAIDAWFTHTFACSWFDLNLDRGMGTPFRSAALDFKAPLTPRDLLETEVYLTKIGRKSLAFHVKGFGVSSERGRCLCFTGDSSIVFVTKNPMRSANIPPDFIEKLKLAGLAV
ncbi:MAG: acyl-CoA thioesterase [Fimbriimonadaceae bacterium]|nr:acyl-CoA thioesterase [Alphaproteobacteria bacterium]